MVTESRIKPFDDSRPRKKHNQAHRLPDNWEPRQEDILWAKEQHPNVNTEFETHKFRDYWRGTGGTKLDWDATWRNWIRRSFAIQRPHQSVFANTSTVAEANRQRLNQLFSELAEPTPPIAGELDR